MIVEIGKKAKAASRILSNLPQKKKMETLLFIADKIEENVNFIVGENEKDIKIAKENGMKAGLIDRLFLDEKRVFAMANGIRQVAKLSDPIGVIEETIKRDNGLLIGKMRVPIGVVGMIYESRPNVTSDAFSICFKTGNAVILRGGSDSINSCVAIGKVIQEALEKCEIDKNCIQVIEDTSREVVTKMLTLNEYIDLIIPRGSERLINHVVKNATVPVIKTGTGNCHIYVDESANIDMALNIIENAKTQRIGVCNACESIVVHKNILETFIPKLVERLEKHNVEMRADEEICKVSSKVKEATSEDFYTEYLDYIVSIKTVSSLKEAIAHINEHSTGHSEAIITDSYENSQKFLEEIDAACVYVNASTRFTDGEEFGFGAEIGISTQKLHARGPMGLLQMTSVKYVIYGNGQVR